MKSFIQVFNSSPNSTRSPLGREGDHGLEVAQPVTGAVAAAPEDHAVHTAAPAGRQGLQAVRPPDLRGAGTSN